MADSNRNPPRPPSTPVPQSRSPGGLNERLIAERISTLLSHYWTSNDPPETRALQLDDWITDLASYPASVVAAACADWRRNEERRPTPAAIRKLCEEHAVTGRRPMLELPEQGPTPPADWHARQAAGEAAMRAERDRKFAEAAAAREAWAREHGCASFGEALQIGLALVERRGALPPGTRVPPPKPAPLPDVSLSPHLLSSAADRVIEAAPAPSGPPPIDPDEPLPEPPPPDLEIEF